MYNAKDIAVYIINYCNSINMPITNLKLQKILYFLQYEWYCKTGKQLIKDNFYAYQLGPVIPKLYSLYSVYASFTLPEQNDEIEILEKQKEKINDILNRYLLMSTWDLVFLSQKQDAWKYTYQIFGDKSIIPYQTITTFANQEN